MKKSRLNQKYLLVLLFIFIWEVFGLWFVEFYCSDNLPANIEYAERNELVKTDEMLSRYGFYPTQLYLGKIQCEEKMWFMNPLQSVYYSLKFNQ